MNDLINLGVLHGKLVWVNSIDHQGMTGPLWGARTGGGTRDCRFWLPLRSLHSHLNSWLMRDTRLGERTAVEAVGSGFSEAAALTSCEETTIGSPGCEDATWCPALRLYLKRGRRKLHWKKEPLLSCCWFCLAVIMVRKAFTTKKQNNWRIYCLKQTAPCTAEKNNTCDSRNPHVASRRTIPWPPLTSIALARF